MSFSCNLFMTTKHLMWRGLEYLGKGIIRGKAVQLVVSSRQETLLSRSLKETSLDKMENSFCVIPLQPNPKFSEVEVLRSTYIANCVFNSFLSYTAVMLNIVTIHAIRKSPFLPKTLKTLLLNLAVSDVGVGLLGQPFYTSLVVEWLLENNPGCNANIAFIFIVNMFSFVSFFGVVAVSVDRLLAIHLHLRYQELVTHKRVVAVVILIWLLSAFLPLTLFWIPLNNFLLIKVFLGVTGVLLTTVAYIRIYLAVKRHKYQIQASQVQQIAENGEMANFSNLVKSAVGVFFVYVVFLTCYLPYFISLVALNICGSSITMKRFLLYSWTIMLLNSSLNPVIYCWKMRNIRHTIMDILRNMPRLRNRTSHFS